VHAVLVGHVQERRYGKVSVGQRPGAARLLLRPGASQKDEKRTALEGKTTKEILDVIKRNNDDAGARRRKATRADDEGSMYSYEGLAAAAAAAATATATRTTFTRRGGDSRWTSAGRARAGLVQTGRSRPVGGLLDSRTMACEHRRVRTRSAGGGGGHCWAMGRSDRRWQGWV